jgi:hypothetical protein
MVIIHYEVEYDMNKLVLLSEARIGKEKDKLIELNRVKSVQEDTNKSYVTFKEKFGVLENKENFVDLKNRNIYYDKCEKRLNKIMKRIFSLDNKVPVIEFINSIYDDGLSLNSSLEYIKSNDIINSKEVIGLKNSSDDVSFTIEDDYRIFEYQIQLQTRDDQNIGIKVSKVDLTNNCDNVVCLCKKKREYEKDNVDKGSKDCYTRCLIMLTCNMEVPDVYDFKSDIIGDNTDNKVNIIKSWKYGFKQLAENNMYLLFPLKVLDLKKRLLSISQEIVTKELIKDEIARFFKDMNRDLRKIKDKNLITDKDINELNLIAIDLLNYFIKEKNNSFVNIKSHIEATLKDIIV